MSNLAKMTRSFLGLPYDISCLIYEGLLVDPQSKLLHPHPDPPMGEASSTDKTVKLLVLLSSKAARHYFTSTRWSIMKPARFFMAESLLPLGRKPRS